MTRQHRRGARVVLTGLLLSGTVLVGSAGRAEAAPPTRTLACGAVLSASVTLANDVGPCTGDGIDIVASGITVNLNGHRIVGTNATNMTSRAQLGVHLINVNGVTLTGPGTITKFDAGVSVEGGQGNTVKRLDVKFNVAHVLLTNDGLDPTAADYLTRLYALPCDYGDGIIVDTSSSNSIVGNTATGNGPFSGISLVGASTGNTLLRNTSTKNKVSNLEPNGTTAGPCGPFSAAGTGQGRPHQDIGIRIEGPGATNNLVAKNHATENQLEGISVHGNICPGRPAPLPPNGTVPNSNNVIEGNTVTGNGFADTTDGIAILSQGPFNTVCFAYNITIRDNVSNGNAQDGISVPNRGSHDNTIVRNTVRDNGRDGIHISGPSGPAPGAVNNTITANLGRGNGSFDGFDGNLTPPCDNNKWTFNSLAVVNQTCIH